MRNMCLSALSIRLVFLGLAGSASVAGAQETSLSGTVLDESGAALPGATVSALSTASGKVTTAVADEAGHFEFEGLPAGPYRLTARLEGFSEAGHSVSLSPGEAVIRDFTLDVGTLSEEITVTAAKGERATSEIPQLVTIVGSNQIEDRRPAGVQEAMERTPGMRTIETNPYRARPQLRGLDGSRVALMVDGERLNNARIDVGVTGVSPAIVEVAHLDSIEVVAGAGSSLYGSDAMAGTVNLITKPPRRPESGVSLDARGDIDYQTNGDFQKGTLAANLASRRLAFRGTVSRFDLDDYHLSGRQGIDREDVLRLGRFAVELGNAFEPGAAAATNVAGSYGVFELPRGSVVPNGGATGWSSLADAWHHLTEKQNVRLKYMRTRQDDLGAPFTGPPYSPLQQIAFFSDFDKVSARYEALEITKWLPRASVGAYRQKLRRPQNDHRFDIVRGSSFVGTTPETLALTGGDSDYVLGINNETENNITSWGFDAQINMLPLRGVLYTTGVGYLEDESVDHFSRETRSADGSIVEVAGLKTTPDTTYRNVGWFNQLEVTRVSWLRLSGGFRIDNWKSEAVPSPGYPPRSELYVQQASLPQIFANPEGLNTTGIQGLGELLDGDGSLTSNNTAATGNIGALLLLSGGVHPYVRFGTSYREPEVTVRYGIRNFGSQSFSLQGIPNTQVKPERGRNLDLGLKLERRSVRACLGYYRNDLSGFSSTVVSPTYEIRPSPADGVLPTSPGAHKVQFFQRVTGNAKVHFRGWEGSGEASIALGRNGSLTPFASLSWMKSIDDDPAKKDILIVQRFYNRSDTPIRLEGSVEEIPARPHPETVGTLALRYTSPAAKWWVEYEWRFAGRITNTDPESVLASVTPFPVEYGGLKSLEGYDKHSIRGGLKLGRDGRLRLTLGIDNVYDAMFFLPYQNAPAPGRSVSVGLTLDMKDLLGS
jgi:outer membrane receptor protein involved in Fe transport